jgi:hypothetical protein
LLDRVRGIEIEQRDIAGAGGVDPVELPVGGAESPADTDATVVTFENQKPGIRGRCSYFSRLTLAKTAKAMV